MTNPPTPHAFVQSLTGHCTECGLGPNHDAHVERKENGMTIAQTEERAQMSMEERELNDPALEAALRSWMDAKASIEAQRDEFKSADDLLSGMVGEREMSAGTYRFGKYVVVISDVAAHQRIKVKLAKE